MTPEQMRELADELDKYVGSPTRASYYPSPVLRVADYLRAQADAQPVRAVPIGHALSAVRHVGSANYPDRERAAIERLYSAEFDAYTRPAPAAPQAEPIDPHMIVAEDRFPDVPAERWKPCPQCGEDVDRECPICDGLGRVLATDGEQAEPKRELTAGERDVLDSALRSSVRLVARGVAEPKREPLTYEQLVSACYTYRHDFGLLDPDEQELVIEEAGRWAKAFGIGGSDAE